MKTIPILSILMLTLSCNMMPAKKVYLSVDGDDRFPGSKKKPLQSIPAARQVIRKIRSENPKRDINVILGEGTWYLSDPVLFTPEDGGTSKCRVRWEGAPDGKTIISGGKVINGFQDAGFGLWWARVDPDLNFEQLYVDGARAIRARTPNQSDSLPLIYLKKSAWVYNTDSSIRNITVEVNDRGSFKDLVPGGEFEVVVFKDWTISRFHVSSLNGDPAELYLKPPFNLFDGPYNSIFAGSANRYSCYLEGDPVFIDQPGEWALDKKTNRLYYKPLPGQSPDKIWVVAAAIPQLVTIKGEPGRPVQNLELQNLSFQHCAFLLPETSHDGMQAAYFYPAANDKSGLPGLISPAINLEWATSCTIKNCIISSVGGNGILIGKGSRSNRIEQTTVEDIGANGIMVGLTSDPGKDSLSLPLNNLVTGCTIHKAGVAFQGSVGVWLGFCAGTEISGCEVYDLPYTGISVGWQWNPLPTSSKNNKILNNRIHHAMQILGDGGGIYTLGFQPGSVISGNDIHDILRSELNHASPNNGMFIDEGSKGYLIENNTISKTAHTCIRGHRTSGVELVGNTFYTTGLPAVSHTPPYEAMIFTDKDTTIRWPNPGWPKEWGYPDTITAFTMKRNTYIRK